MTSDPALRWWMEKEERREQRRREHLKESKPHLFVDFDLVEVVEHPVSEQAKALARDVHPGSALVAHGDREDGTCIVDYEGGILVRDGARPPTDDERRGYALVAAGRAAERYPTVARMHGIPRVDLRVVGTVNLGNREVAWVPDTNTAVNARDCKY